MQKVFTLDLCPIPAVRDRQMSRRKIFALDLHDLPPAHNKAIARPEGVSQSQFASNIVTLKYEPPQQEIELIVSPFIKTLSNLTHHDKIKQEEACRRTGKGDSQGQIEAKEKRHGIKDKEQPFGEKHEQLEPKENSQDGRRCNNINKVIARGERADTTKTFTKGAFWHTTKKQQNQWLYQQRRRL